MKKIGIVLVVIIVLAAIGSSLGSDDEPKKNTEVTENVSEEAAQKEDTSSGEERQASEGKEDTSVDKKDLDEAKETLSDLTEKLKDTVDEATGKKDNDVGEKHPGDSVTFGDFKITYKAVGKYKSDNQFIQPKEGFQYLKYDFVFKNTGKNDSYIGEFSCYADGEKCDTAYVGDSAGDFLLTKLSAGRKKSGSIIFEVPKNAKLKDIELEYANNSLWSDKKIIFLAK